MDIGLLALHVIPGALFMGHGAQKLFGLFGGHGIEGTGGFMETLGLRPGRVHATLAGGAELFGGLLLALGLLVPLAAAVLIATMVTASLTAHRAKGIWNENGGFELPLVFATIAFALAAV
ncbi:MAG TPA: DoxX family membrane protein, partial [Thermoleophilaceae bacterium]|nr:DoxX family membrane protein [Thermoleophilaceae bacterium]